METIAAAIAWPGREDPEYQGILPNRNSSPMRLVRSLEGPHREAMSLAYEASTCGYGAYRKITAMTVRAKLGDPTASTRPVS